MRKLLFFVLLALGVCGTSFAENEPMLVDYGGENSAKKQDLLESQLGHHFGATFTLSSLIPSDNPNNSQIGGNLFYGYRLNKHWMLGGSIGVENISSEVHYEADDYGTIGIIKRPTISVPILAEARFYFGSSRVMPYLYADLGAAISKYSGAIFNAGIGLDVNIYKSHTIFASLGLGTTTIPTVEFMSVVKDPELDAKSIFDVSFRFGYYF